MTRFCLKPLVIAATVLPGLCAAWAGEPRLNQIQVIGSHNSYHIAPHADLLKLISATSKRLGESIDYTHRPLAEQFSQLGIRQIELDLFHDPKGGLFAEPSFRKTLKTLGRDAGPDPNTNGRLAKPGLKVLHVQDIDYQTTTPTFQDALQQVRRWSLAHAGHVPIFILLELKDGQQAGLPTKPAKFDKAALDQVEAEIDRVFPAEAVFTPDDLRGTFQTLPEAIAGSGWPELKAVGGQVLFLLDNEGALRDLYINGAPNLAGRRLFVTPPLEDHPSAAFFKINDPVKDFDRIQRLVKAGYLVRTRADADTRQARANDTTQRDRALASGAQLVSTDFAEPRPAFSPYVVRLPEGAISRPNPVNGGR